MTPGTRATIQDVVGGLALFVLLVIMFIVGGLL